MPYNLSALLRQRQNALKLTKMICTIGPASSKPEVIESLLRSGMTVARLNFSHGTHQQHYDMLKVIKETASKMSGIVKPGIMLDTKGPEIRTGGLADPKEPIPLKKGQKIRLTTDYSVKSSSEVISFSYPELYNDLEVGSKILLADGNLSLKIVEKDESSKTLIAEVKNDFKLGSNKNVNLPGVKISLPVIGKKDQEDLVDFGLKHQVDFIALSFTTTAESVKMCRDVLGEAGKRIKVICKIENQEGLGNVEKILKASDGVMIARGDLGMEMKLQKMFMAQTYITELARRHNKICVMATQMLESMTANSRPTRAEITDVANAVKTLVDSTMLSGETGGGQYAPESAETMSQIALETEAHMDFKSEFLRKQLFDYENGVGWYGKESGFGGARERVETRALALSAVSQSFDGQYAGIIVSGEEQLVKDISALRPSVPIFYFNENEDVLRRLTLNFGVFPMTDKGGALKGFERRVVEASAYLSTNKAVKRAKHYLAVDGDAQEISVIK